MRKKKMFTRFRVIVPFLLILAVLIAGCGSDGGSGLKEERSTLSVTGYGQASGAPDLAEVQLGVSVIDPDIGQSIREANAAIERVTEAVVARGVSSDDVRTVNYSIWTEYIHDPQTGMPTGETKYHVEISIFVTVRDVLIMGDLINASLGAGATNIHNINFSIDDVSFLETEARGKAIADARDRAEKLASGLGMKLGKVLSVGEGSAGALAPTYSYGLKGDLGGGGVGAGQPSIISPGQTTIGVQVTVIYELLP
ncbi:MAG: DUF541 domain-containing protein [Anaerolineales bacterium]|nr:DUF541 domain-containing protein [Anaerolineales bacterium]